MVYFKIPFSPWGPCISKPIGPKGPGSPPIPLEKINK